MTQNIQSLSRCYNQVDCTHMSHTVWMWHFIASTLFALAKSSCKAVLVSVACVTNHICVIICVPCGLCTLTVSAVCDMSKEKCGDGKKENTQWCVVLTVVLENTSFSLFVVKSTCAGLHDNFLISQFHLIGGHYPFFSHIFGSNIYLYCYLEMRLLIFFLNSWRVLSS
jgi:hypothetical protein